MGLFDKFRKKVKVIVDEANSEDLTEAREDNNPKSPSAPPPLTRNESKPIRIASPVPDLPVKEETEWDEWDSEEEEESEDPWKKLSKKERKKLKKEAKKARKEPAINTKPKGSEVDLQMIRSTTGRQLVKVEQAPRGSSGIKNIELEGKTSKLILEEE